MKPRRAEIESAAARAQPPRHLTDALRSPGLSVIAEIKRRSPSAGSIAPDLDPEVLGRAYVAGGASAISVLTEPVQFGGSLADLETVAAVSEVPVLRKDFIVDRVQVDEARAAGADAFLLIVAILADEPLADLIGHSRGLGMEPLVEVHDAGELQRAVDAGARVVGVNNRDLNTFDVDLGTAERLRRLIPDDVVAVAESGVNSPEDARRMHKAGFDAVLVGQAAAESADPAAFVASLAEQ